MRYDGAKFYSKDDLSYAFNLEKAEGVIKAFSDEKDFGINEILELYNIERLFEHGVVLTFRVPEALLSSCERLSGISFQ